MSAATAVLLLLTVGTFAFKSAGPMFIGARPLPQRIQNLVDLLPAALLAALAAVSTFGVGESLVVDARAAGMVVACVALWRRVPFVFVILLASAATALVRQIA
jgi:branched-subunit amino acid transport protein